MTSLLAPVQELLDAGGFVMPWLIGAAFVLWATIGWRFLALRTPGARRSIAAVLAVERDRSQPMHHSTIRQEAAQRVAGIARFRDMPPRAVIEHALFDLRSALGGGRTLVRTLVVLAPLAGLLGTVTGMIETFRSLADMALFTQGGGIAGGIAEALLTTQMGLAVSVPGLVVGRALDRREARLHADLDLLTELVCSRPLDTIGPAPTETSS